jgi:hypothetical protein
VISIVSIKNWIARNGYVFPLLAFLIPFVIRVIPEILMGPYVVGFDTMGFYIPNTLHWLQRGIDFGDYLSTAPLFYALYMSLVSLGGQPVLVLKVMSPMLLGFLGLSIYLYAKRGLRWCSSKSFFVALLGTIYFVALRASWDQLREELGLIFFFIVLTLLLNKQEQSWKRFGLISFVMFTIALSHQLVSVLMFGLIFFTILLDLHGRDFRDAIKIFIVSLPAVLYFLFVYLRGVLSSGIINYSVNVESPLYSWGGFSSYLSMLVNESELFFYCFILLLPLTLISIWKLRNFQLRIWLLFSFILMLLPIASVSPYRWVLLLSYPLAFYATDALSQLRSIKYKRFKFNFFKAATLYLVLSTAIVSFGYILATPEKPFFYFNAQYTNRYSYQIPTSMLQNTISITDCGDTVNALQWFRDNLNDSALLLTHTVFYSWALMALDNNQVRNYGFNDPGNAAMLLSQESTARIYLIWWVNGTGWYNEPVVPSSFNELYASGNIAIYQYEGY